ncbi:hypothetical protein [Streptomyces sp. NPDC051014]|uniref:hypothetical protein n=1 Tax=Streptomyces sp. NPDC051014 TaxID=3155751 RepID=UPI0033D44E06
MSVTGVWVVGTVPDERARDLLSRAVPESSPTRLTAGCDVSAERARWRAKAPESLFKPSTTAPGSWTADDDAFRLSAFIDSCYDDSEHAESLRDAVMDEFPPDAGQGLFAAVARKAGPFSALAYALGPDAVMRLPGWFGDFLLDAEQVRARLPAVEETLALTGVRRREAIERIQVWMTGLGDDPDHDADELLDGPLRVLHHAVRTGQGAAGQVRRY